MSDRPDNEKKGTIAEAFLEHRDIMAAYLARRVLSTDDVDDILQEAFVRAFAAEKANLIDSPKSYLFMVARNLLSKQLAKQRKVMIRELDDATLVRTAAEDVPIDMQVHTKQKLQAFSTAVESLPSQCRRVFLLRKLYGLSHKQISARLGISTSTIERHITNALTRLNQNLQADGYNREQKVTRFDQNKQKGGRSIKEVRDE